MNNLDKKYLEILEDILDNGIEKKDRTGTGTISVFGRQIRHKMSEGFPLLTTKKMAFKPMVVELLWFLRGDTNIKYLIENGCHIWDGDAYKKFFLNAEKIKTAYEEGDLLGTQPHIESMFSNPDKLIILTKEEFIERIKTDDDFANEWGELGPIYGKQWRRWTNKVINGEYVDNPIDQIQQLIDNLKNNPDSRRLMVNAWKVEELEDMTLPPCHYGFQCYTRELTHGERFDYALDVLGYEGLLDYGHMNSIKYPNIVDEMMDKYNVPRRSISLMWNQRSVDTFLGLPFNIASYGLLLTMLANEVNMIPDELIGNLGDTHLYLNHIQQAHEQLGRYPFHLPTIKVNGGIYCSEVNDVILENYQSHPKIEAPLSN